MADPLIYDFDFIARRIREIRGETLPENENEDDEYCEKCEGGGWVPVYSPSPPEFEICQMCFNPKSNPRP